MVYEWVYDCQINIVDDHYDNVCELCDETINKVLELNESFDLEISSISEDFIDDAFLKQINIIIKL